MPMHRWRFSYRIFLIVFLVYLTHNIRTIHAQYTHNSNRPRVKQLKLSQPEKLQKKQLFLLISKYFCTFAVANPSHRFCRHIIKAFISACFGFLKLGNFQSIQNKKAVNALWDMYIPPQSVPSWTALFGGISYSAWALLACSYR